MKLFIEHDDELHEVEDQIEEYNFYKAIAASHIVNAIITKIEELENGSKTEEV